MTMNNSDYKTYPIGHRHQLMIVNWNHMYSSYYKIIKYIEIESIIYVINLDVVFLKNLILCYRIYASLNQ